MFYPNSAPQYFSNHSIQEYLDIFYVWMLRIGADGPSLKSLNRLARISRVNILTPSLSSMLTESLNILAENLNSSELKTSDINPQLKKIELKLNNLCSKSRLVSMMSSIESRLTRSDNATCEYRPLFRRLFQRLCSLEFSKIQAEGIIRDLKVSCDPKPQELQEIFNAWL